MNYCVVPAGGEINLVDLFCGCGGNMSGCHDAAKELGLTYSGLAINHWAIAVDTMRANFPDVTTLDCKIEEAVPGQLVHNTVHLLWASPSCTHHSRAAGGRPRNDQLRSQPAYVTTWLSDCNVLTLIVENVPEFMEWGPLDPETGKPIKERRGETFKAWVKMIESLGYQVEYRVLNCADYGDATTRKRFFLIATKVGLPPPKFPAPTHGDHVKGLEQWRPIRDCLNLADTGRSIFGRSHPLVKNTLYRIADGARKYWGLDITGDMLVEACGRSRRGGKRVKGGTGKFEPFIVKLRHCETVDTIDNPVSTVTAGGGHHALCTAHLVCDHHNHGGTASLDRPAKTATTHDSQSLVTLVIGQHGGSTARPVDLPMPTACTSGRMRTITPVIVDLSHTKDKRKGADSADRPIRTITGSDSMSVAFLTLEDGRWLDIRMRMVTPEELALAHSLPPDFVLCGNRSERVKQVGNSVPARTAKALCLSVLRELVA